MTQRPSDNTYCDVKECSNAEHRESDTRKFNQV